MDYQEIRYGPAEGAGPQVVQVTLDRPAALNAYTSRMCEELNDALLRYARDEDARVLVLTGAGRAFCAGGDVASQAEVEEATRMTLLSELYDASTAQQLGLVGEVVPDEQLHERTVQLADELAARASLAVRVAKRMMRRSLELTFEQSLGDAEYAVNIVNDSEDVQEGVAAFLEKRAPVFRGR